MENSLYAIVGVYESRESRRFFDHLELVRHVLWIFILIVKWIAVWIRFGVVSVDVVKHKPRWIVQFDEYRVIVVHEAEQFDSYLVNDQVFQTTMHISPLYHNSCILSVSDFFHVDTWKTRIISWRWGKWLFKWALGGPLLQSSVYIGISLGSVESKNA